MHITFVKKILEDGSLCKKCREVSERLEADGVDKLINEIAVADTRDSSSLGMQLANEHKVERAPFFIVDHNDEALVFDVYFKLRKFLNQQGLLANSEKSL